MGLKILAGIIIGGYVLFGIFRMLKLKKASKEVTKEYNWKTDKDKFKKEFIQLITEKPNLNYLVISFDKYYIQFMGWENIKEFYCETISNEFLEAPNQLNDVKIKKIIELKFLEPNSRDSNGNTSPNYSKFYRAGNNTERGNIFKEIEFILNKIYEIKSNEILKVRHE